MMYRGKKVHKGTKPGVFFIMIGNKKQYVPKKDRPRFETANDALIRDASQICGGLRY